MGLYDLQISQPVMGQFLVKSFLSFGSGGGKVLSNNSDHIKEKTKGYFVLSSFFFFERFAAFGVKEGG